MGPGTREEKHSMAMPAESTYFTNDMTDTLAITWGIRHKKREREREREAQSGGESLAGLR